MVAVVAGGSGEIGAGIVSAFLSAGMQVYVPTKPGDSARRLKALPQEMEKPVLIETDLCDYESVLGLKERILEEESRIDAVVVSVGADYYGHRLHRMPQEEWERSVSDNLLTHFNLQRVFVDQLRKQYRGVYLTMVGPEAESVRSDGGLVSIMAAAQKMMARVSAQEALDSDIRVHSVTARTTIHSPSRGADGNADWIDSADLGAYVLALVEGRAPSSGETRHELQDSQHVARLLKQIKNV